MWLIRGMWFIRRLLRKKLAATERAFDVDSLGGGRWLSLYTRGPKPKWQKNAELVKSFSEEAYSVAFHPSGLHILVGFADKLRLMNLLMDDIRPYKEFAIKMCRECRFSTGGDKFAAVNGNTIQIYSTYTCENIGNLRGHNGKVRSLHWSPDDTKFVSAGLDGAIYEWSISDFKRQNENVLKSCNYSSVAASPDFNSLFAVGSDRKLKQLENAQILKEFESEVALDVMSKNI